MKTPRLDPKRLTLLNKEWAVMSDQVCVTLCRSYIGKTGKRIWKHLGYYNNLSHALQVFVDKSLQGEEIKSLEHINLRINELKNDIAKVLGPASPLKEII